MVQAVSVDFQCLDKTGLGGITDGDGNSGFIGDATREAESR